MTPASSEFNVVTVTLNPAIDRTITIPHFTPGAVNRVRQSRDTAGGKGVNVAAALAGNGHHVAVTGFLGSENTRLFEALFAEKQISDQFIRIAGETRVGIKIVDPVQGTTTDINFPGFSPTAGEIAAFWEKIEALDAEWFVLGGSLPLGMEPAIYRDLTTRLKTKGRKVVVDASDEALRHAIEAGPTVIKPNVHELEALLGKPLRDEGEVIDAARKLVNQGIELVAVSMGKEGACFANGEGAVIARPPALEVLSAVGAGDAMVAGIVAAQLRGLSLEECARVATAFSVQALSGCNLATAMERVTHTPHRAC
ncbi:MAG: 1-phosphofructokinase [Verrucomicrobiota bacterium]